VNPPSLSHAGRRTAHGERAPRTAVIIGAGPAGLTAAYELLTRTDIKPIVLEMTRHLGGIARTVNYKGNRIDIGGHRFFSKSDRVMQWWLHMLPLQTLDTQDSVEISYQGMRHSVRGAERANPLTENDVMLLRTRKSSILFNRRLFDYPIALNAATLSGLGLGRSLRIAASYCRARAFPRRPESNLEQFFINRFGTELYNTFFKTYTEKVWGRPCHQISAEWGAQRIKNLSVSAAVAHFIRVRLRPGNSIAQKDTETSLIERFLYPKYGCGQMWESCARMVTELGGQIMLGNRVERLSARGDRLQAVHARDAATGRITRHRGDYFFSTMPVKDLVCALGEHATQPVREVSDALEYRSMIVIGLLLHRIELGNNATGGIPHENWLYVHDPRVKLGRLQIFNNWSPGMVTDPAKVWIGLEYFCDEGDTLWCTDDAALARLGIAELRQLGLIRAADVIDHTVIREAKTYPGYFGAYRQFPRIRGFLDGFSNLYPIGRNGMHRYNNQDHSMLTAMTAVDNIVAGVTDKTPIWNVNTEQDYHEHQDTGDGPRRCAGQRA